MPERIGRWGPTFPKEVTPEFRQALSARTPHIWVTPAIIWANSLVHAAMAIGGADPWAPSSADAIKWGANYGHLTLGGQWWRLFTSAFVHFGTPHLVLNMLVLWSVGYLVEGLVGNVGFLVAYLLAAVVGSIASLAWNPYAVAAGASGAIFGVYGLLLAYLARARESVPKELVRRLAKVAGIFVIVNLVLGGAIQNVDLADHVGGLVAGFGAGLLLARPLGTKGSRIYAWVRTLCLGLLGAAAVAATLKVVPAPVDLSAEMDGVRDVRDSARVRYFETLMRYQARMVTNLCLADRLDDDIRPALRGELDRLRSLARLRGRQKTMVTEVSRQLRLEEHSLGLLSRAVRDQDIDAFGKAKKLMDRANASTTDGETN